MKRKILNSIASQMLYITVSSAIGLSLVPITINMLGKIEYGAFELILSLIFIDAFLEFGLGSTLVKYIPEYKADVNRLKIFFWSYYYIKLFLTVLGLIVILFIGYNFDLLFNLEGINDIENIRLAVYIFGLGLLINSLVSFLDNFLRGYVYFGLANGVKVAALILFFIIYYLYYIENISSGYSIVYISLIWFILRPLISLFLIIWTLKYLKLNYILHPVKFDFMVVKHTLHYMYGMTYIVMVAQIANKLPKIILGIFMTPIYVAYWGIMEKIREPLLQLNSSLLRPLIPILSDKKNIIDMSDEKVIQASRLQYLLMSFLGIMVIVHIDLLIKIWIGEEFNIVSKIVKVIMVTFLFPSAGVFLMMYYAEGKTKINRFFTTVHSLLGLSIGTIVLFTTRDIMLFTWTFSIVSIIISLLSIITYINYFKINKIHFLTKSVFRPFEIMVIYYLIISYINPIFSLDFLGLVYSITVSLLLYIVLFFMFMKNEDKVIAFKMIGVKI